MSKAKYIKIEQLKIRENQLLLFKLSFSREVRKYFSSNLFYVEYDTDVHNVNKTILQIPVISNVVPIAWAIGADIHVKELDEAYLECLNKIKPVMLKWYPNLPFSTNIEVDNIVSNNFGNKGYGLLFSGGLDSTVSYIRHKEKKPNLIMVWGADIRLDRERFWRKIKNQYKDFADKENVKINLVKTNMRQFMNEALLNIKFGRYLTDSSWWSAIHHGIGLLGLCAPISVPEHMGAILIASSHTPELLEYPWGSHPLIDNNVSWADVKVVHDGYDLSRQDKIRCLKSYIRKCNRYPRVRVCWSQYHISNCGRCEKCSRTITGLVLENIDPNKCGFNISSDFFNFLKQNFVKRRFDLSRDRVLFWRDIQRHIPKQMGHNLYDCREFFRWFKDFEISEVEKRDIINIREHLIYLFYQLPENMQRAILRLPHKDFVKAHLLR